jgi:hypothetical protein
MIWGEHFLPFLLPQCIKAITHISRKPAVLLMQSHTRLSWHSKKEPGQSRVACRIWHSKTPSSRTLWFCCTHWHNAHPLWSLELGYLPQAHITAGHTHTRRARFLRTWKVLPLPPGNGWSQARPKNWTSSQASCMGLRRTPGQAVICEPMS